MSEADRSLEASVPFGMPAEYVLAGESVCCDLAASCWLVKRTYGWQPVLRVAV